MKLYKTGKGIITEREDKFRIIKVESWDHFINDDHLFEKLKGKIGEDIDRETALEMITQDSLAPIQHQEVWASGVTYFNSKLGREQESKESGGGSFYAQVYEAERPELFFKATPHRVVGTGQKVRIRADSNWNVPEPELTLLIASSGKIIGYTIGNDMSSRSIEGENPLYLPQAKSYDGSAAIGPCILVADAPLDPESKISMDITRSNKVVFQEEIAINQIKRSFEELVGFLYRECSFPYGSFLMTGTGIVPGPEFTLQSNDVIKIKIEGIGVLENTVA